MNGQPATQPEARPAPCWTARLEECRPEAPPAAAAWLSEPGLLTERLRACCDGQPGLSVISEAEAPLAAHDAAVLQASGNAAFVREIELTCDGRPWVFAQTLIPQATLARQRWLSVARPRRARRTPRRRARPRARAARVHPPRRWRSPLPSRAARPVRSAAIALGTPLLVRDRGRSPAGAGSVPARSARVSTRASARARAGERRCGLQAGMEAASAARRVPRARPDAPRVRAPHAPAQADRHLAPALARAVGTLDRGRWPARSAHLVHIHRSASS